MSSSVVKMSGRNPLNGLSDEVESVCLRFAPSRLSVMEAVHYLQACSSHQASFPLMILLGPFHFEGEFLREEGRGSVALSNFTFCLHLLRTRTLSFAFIQALFFVQIPQLWLFL